MQFLQYYVIANGDIMELICILKFSKLILRPLKIIFKEENKIKQPNIETCALHVL